MNKLREVSTKVGELEDMLTKLLRDMKTLNIQELRDAIAEIQKRIAGKA